ncbi:DUF4148 domain-containing protein [Limnobacter sp.]|uniref:DUF4148 domain-containing protein n=1 Tax=Limnobacter sp. TaxID=2003368 RepID=UPI002735E089|nr:DUF4148 domain-containing protein [Limnobacter sp.]MDP3272281.1 DUF4148 domain-containing protein [Limnobacter sp.]
MTFRKTVFALALAGAVLPAAFANSGRTWAGADDSVHISTQQNQSDKSRADVKKGASMAQNNAGAAAISADGAKNRSPQHSFELQGGRLVHSDNLPHNNAKPALVRPDLRQDLFSEGYGA